MKANILVPILSKLLQYFCCIFSIYPFSSLAIKMLNLFQSEWNWWGAGKEMSILEIISSFFGGGGDISHTTWGKKNVPQWFLLREPPTIHLPSPLYFYLFVQKEIKWRIYNVIDDFESDPPFHISWNWLKQFTVCFLPHTQNISTMILWTNSAGILHTFKCPGRWRSS